MITANVRKDFRFLLEIEGTDQFFIQEVDMPDYEITTQMHGGLVNNPDVKTAGKPKVGDMVMRKIKPILVPDNWAWILIENARANTPFSGYAINAILKEVDETGIRTLARYNLVSIFPKKITGLKYKRAGDGENLIEEITWAVNDFHKDIEF